MGLTTLIILCTVALAVVIIICAVGLYNGLSYDLDGSYLALRKEIQSIQSDLERVSNDIGNIEPNYCNYPDPLKEDDDYF